MVMSKLQKKIANRLMHMTIYRHIRDTYFKKGIIPTAEQAMQDIDKKALDTLLSQGYTEEEVKSMVEDVIRRQTCKE